MLGDPQHRKKGLKTALCEAAKLPVKRRCGLREVDITRLSTNFAYLSHQLPVLPKHLWLQAAAAVLDHHFDMHAGCGDWCQWKDQTAQERQDSGKFYRCKHKDSALYDMLHEIISRFITLPCLEEIGHGLDTNCNEALNNLIAWVAPKNKTYSGTGSLKTRINVNISIHSIGFMQFFLRLFHKLGIEVTPSTRHWLQQQLDW